MIVSKKFNKYSLVCIILIIGVVVLLLPAFINHYPLLFSDVGTYIYSGFSNIVPKDRPIFYGLFVRYASFGKSLWFVVIAQAIITYYVIYTFIRSNRRLSSHVITGIIIICLYITTGISEYVSQIMPDIFAGLSLVIFLTAFCKKFSIFETVSLGIILIFSGACHYSLILVNTCFLFFFITYYFLFRKKKSLSMWNVVSLSILISITWLIIPMVNRAYSGNSSMAKYKSVILTSRLIQSGIMKTFLEENCNDHNYVLCNNIEQIQKMSSAADFVWRLDSPLYNDDCLKKGDEECWKQMSPKLDSTIFDLIHIKKYQKLIAFEIFRSSFSQIVTIDLKTFQPMLEGSPIYYPMNKFLKNDYKRYMNAKQAKDTVTFFLKDRIIKLFYLISAIGILTILILRRNDSFSFQNNFVVAGIVVFSILNAIICANLSSVVGRYQGRIEWTFMLVFLVLLFQMISQKMKLSEI
jgi:hypothetical protein